MGNSAEVLAPKLRRFPYQPHIIFYIPNNDGVYIVRILRKEMDFNSQNVSAHLSLSITHKYLDNPQLYP